MSPVPAMGETPRTRPPKGGRRYRMTIAYDGTAYYGWQAQPAHPTVQGRIEEALKHLTDETIRLHACGRTDTGVHARGQVAHFDLALPWEPHHLQKGLNGCLPDDIRISSLTRTRPDFHARYNATGKEYRYLIWNAPVADPLNRLTTLHERRSLDLAAMRAAAARLTGTLDFTSFSANPGREIGSLVRTIWRFDVRRRGPLITLSVLGDGFLYKMVRSLAGHLLRVGRGAVAPEETTALLEARERTARVETARPHGLCLWKIHYGAIPGLPKTGSL